jgi:site-specific recombinase XerD
MTSINGWGRRQAGNDIRAIQELPGRKDVKKTMVYTHVLNRGGRGVRSPFFVRVDYSPF